MIKTGLQNFYKITSYKPAAIIFFRPGANEAEMNQLTSVELKMINDACTQLDEDYK